MVELADTPEPNIFSSNAGSLLANSFRIRLLSRPDLKSQHTRMPLQAGVRVRAWPLAGVAERVGPTLTLTALDRGRNARPAPFDAPARAGALMASGRLVLTLPARRTVP